MLAPAFRDTLRVLREAGLVSVAAGCSTKDLQRRPEPLAEIDEWLSRYRALGSSALMRCMPEVAGQEWKGATHDRGRPAEPTHPGTLRIEEGIRLVRIEDAVSTRTSTTSGRR